MIEYYLATHSDFPPNSQVVIINQTTGARVNETSAYITASGSGNISMPFPPTMPAGTYYLKGQDYSTQAYIAQTVSFTAQAQTASYKICGAIGNTTITHEIGNVGLSSALQCV